MKIFIDPGHGIQNVIIVSIHCNAYGNGTTWTSPRGWSAYTSRGQTPADARIKLKHLYPILNF